MILCTMATGCGQKAVKTPEPKDDSVPAIELSNMDTAINPADDFFRFCNNDWLKNNPIPEEYTSYGAFTEIDQHNEILIQEIIDEVSKDANAKQGSMASFETSSMISWIRISLCWSISVKAPYEV